MACGGGSPVLDNEETSPLIDKKELSEMQTGHKPSDKEAASGQDLVSEETENQNPESSEKVELTASQMEENRRKRLEEMRRRRRLRARRRAYMSYYLYFRQRFPERLLPYGVGQLVFFSLLILWPVSLGVMGFIHLADCPMNQFMVFTLLLESTMGIAALGSRLALIVHMIKTFPHRLAPDPLVNFMWKLVKWLEFLFLCYFIVQLTCYYWQGYSTDPSSSSYCNPTLYSFITGMNYFTLTMVVIWLNCHFYNWYTSSNCC